MFSCYLLVQIISVLITTVDCYIPYNSSDGHSWKIYLNNHGNCGKYISSHRRCSKTKRVLKNFAKFTGKHLCQSLQRFQACNFIKKETLAQVFSCEFYEIFKNTFFTELPRTTASVNILFSIRINECVSIALYCSSFILSLYTI